MQTWPSFKARAGNGRFQDAFQATDAVVKHLTARRDGDVIAMILFGSLARRRSTYDDIDILIEGTFFHFQALVE